MSPIKKIYVPQISYLYVENPRRNTKDYNIMYVVICNMVYMTK